MWHVALMCVGDVFFDTLTASRGANCTAKFEGLVRFAALNGAPTNGTPAQFSKATMTSLDEVVMETYMLDMDSSTSGVISKSEACREIYFKFNCARLTSMRVTSDAAAPYHFAAPCNAVPGNSTGARMLKCSVWCTEFLVVCLQSMPRKWCDDICKPWTASDTEAYFDNDGLKSSASGTGTQAPGRVGMLTVVVMHYLLN
jgi:hypothetical protein